MVKKRGQEPKSAKGLGATIRKEKKKRSFKIDMPSWLYGLKQIQWGGLRNTKWGPVLLVFGFCTISTLLVTFWDETVSTFDREVASIEIRGQLKYQQPEALQKTLNKHLGKGFFSLDLNAVKDEVEAMPWIYSASLRRRWPGTLMITVKEQYPVASWNDEYYLNEFGEAFQPWDSSDIGTVPDLIGPSDRAKDVLKQYVNYREQLAVINEQIAVLSLETRGAWRLTLQSGIEIKLGRAPLEEKLDRFLIAYKQGLNNRLDDIQSIDARYTNGIAVRWKEEDENKTGKPGAT